LADDCSVCCADGGRQQAGAAPMLHVTCWDTFYVSNLTSHLVQLAPLHAADPACGPIECGAGETAPASIAWAAATSRPAEAAAAAAEAAVQAVKVAAAGDAGLPAASAAPQSSAVTWPCTVEVQLAATAADITAVGRHGSSGSRGAAEPAGGNGVGASGMGAGDSGKPGGCGARVSLAEPCGRRWLALGGVPGGDAPRQLAYRLRRVRGRHHLVLYEDQQPPLRLVNATGAALEAGLSPPQQVG